jgi:hypothetical protein
VNTSPCQATINLKGNLTSSNGTIGSSTGATGTLFGINLIGTTTQHWAGKFPNTFPTGQSCLIKVNNSAGVVIDSNSTLNGNDTLSLVNGLLTTSSSAVLTVSGTSGAAVVGGSSSSFINGPLALSGTGNQTYPIGKGTAFRPVTLGTIVGTSPVISVEVFNGNSGGTASSGLSSISTVRYWSIVLASGLFTSGTVNLTYGADDGVTSYGEINVGTQTSSGPNGAYASIGGNATANGSGNITSNSISSLGNSSTPSFFVLGNIPGGTNPLPVEMTSFTASMQSGNCAILKWSTATEVNNSGFEIERRSANSEQLTVNSWQKIGFVSGAGTSNSPKEYTYQDVNLAPGVYVYRIKQIDNNGAFKYSASTQVDAGVAKGFELLSFYPNPFNPTTNVQFSVPQDGYASLKVYNMLGQEVATLFDGMAQAGHYIPATFDGSRFASGVYFSRLQYNGKSLVQRMLMTK